MDKYLNVCNIYLVIWGLYYSQGTFYPFGSIVAKILLLINLIISIYYWVYANIKYTLPQPIKILNIFILILIVHALFYHFSYDYAYKVNTGAVLTGIDSLKGVLSSLLPFFALYTFVMKGFLDEKVLLFWFFIIIIIVTGQYWVYESVRMSRSIYDTDGLTNNIAYQFLAITPFLFFLKTKPLYLYMSAIYILLYIMGGMKRGAILIGVIAMTFIIYKQIKDSNFKQKMFTLLLSAILIVVLYNYWMELSSSNSYFQYRVSKTLEGDSSGRDDYYQLLLNHFINEQSILKILFGGGSYTTVKLVGNLAHNDWIELLICNGLFGFIVYLCFWISLHRYRKDLKNTIHMNVVNLFFIIFFIKTFFSMSYADMGVFALLPLAYCIAENDMSESLDWEYTDETLIS